MTQCERIIEYCNYFGSITSLDAFKDLGITRLSARIHDLEKKGYFFERRSERRNNRFGEATDYTRYFLTKGKK